jgi:hypothetical protein
MTRIFAHMPAFTVTGQRRDDLQGIRWYVMTAFSG